MTLRGIYAKKNQSRYTRSRGLSYQTLEESKRIESNISKLMEMKLSILRRLKVTQGKPEREALEEQLESLQIKLDLNLKVEKNEESLETVTIPLSTNLQKVKLSKESDSIIYAEPSFGSEAGKKIDFLALLKEKEKKVFEFWEKSLEEGAIAKEVPSVEHTLKPQSPVIQSDGLSRLPEKKVSFDQNLIKGSSDQEWVNVVVESGVPIVACKSILKGSSKKEELQGPEVCRDKKPSGLAENSSFFVQQNKSIQAGKAPIPTPRG